MILRIFRFVQYFNKTLAAYLGVKPLSKSSFPYDLALIGTQVVGRCAIFTEIQKSGLDLVINFVK
jgi:hypothetical protein